MLELIPVEDSLRWDNVVTSFKEYDVYYLNGYVRAFQIHGDGVPCLYHYVCDNLRGICVFMRRNISVLPYFHEKYEFEGCKDLITPYGYGGFIFDGACTQENIALFKKEFLEQMRNDSIISVFVRFHPQLRNADYARAIFDVIDLGRTIEMDITSREIIWSNITSKNRNMIRKAQKSGVTISHGRNIELLTRFKEIYDGTMRKDDADPYYFFGENFYKSIEQDFHHHYEIFYALCDGKIVSMAIMIFANGRMHYHLSGSLFEYRSLAATNLMLYEAACWGCDNGFKTFHLGGGLGSHEDNLFKFKEAFNRNSDLLFSIGKLIVDKRVYDDLVSVRVTENNFDKESMYFPLYRKN